MPYINRDEQVEINGDLPEYEGLIRQRHLPMSELQVPPYHPK